MTDNLQMGVRTWRLARAVLGCAPEILTEWTYEGRRKAYGAE